MTKKKFVFVNDAARRALKSLPKHIRQQFGADLQAVQSGKKPFSSFKDVGDSVGTGAIELIENGSPAYRAVYCVKFLDSVYILHAFTKTAQSTDKKNMETAARRYVLMKKAVEEAKKLVKDAAKKITKKR